MSEEPAEWRIDALDARGGLAFVSQRDARFSEADSNDWDPPCAFVGAPGFQPEMVANRSLAIAGIRGAFQQRLYVDGEEVSFPTLASAVEFVRRVYLRSGGGDGADGEGGERPPPLRPEGYDLEAAGLLKFQPGGSVGAVREVIAKFNSASQSCKAGMVLKFSEWPKDLGAPAKYGERVSASPLANAAAGLITEMLQRFPGESNPEMLRIWYSSARNLGKMISGIGLWHELFLDPYRNPVMRLLCQFGRGFKWRVDPNIPQDRAALILCMHIFGQGWHWDDAESAEYWSYYFPFWAVHMPLGESDRAAQLCRIPVPKESAELVRESDFQDASLFHLLVSFTATPSVGSDNEGFCELALLAACWLAMTDQDFTISPNFRSRRRSDVREAEMKAIISRGWGWLREHLPAIAFPPEIERAIKSASDLKYARNEEAGDTSRPLRGR